MDPSISPQRRLTLLPGSKMASLVCSINEQCIAYFKQIPVVGYSFAIILINLDSGGDSPHLRTLASWLVQTLHLIHLEFSLIMGDPRVLIKGTFKNLDGFKSFLKVSVSHCILLIDLILLFLSSCVNLINIFLLYYWIC